MTNLSSKICDGNLWVKRVGTNPSPPLHLHFGPWLLSLVCDKCFQSVSTNFWVVLSKHLNFLSVALPCGPPCFHLISTDWLTVSQKTDSWFECARKVGGGEGRGGERRGGCMSLGYTGITPTMLLMTTEKEGAFNHILPQRQPCYWWQQGKRELLTTYCHNANHVIGDNRERGSF